MYNMYNEHLNESFGFKGTRLKSAIFIVFEIIIHMYMHKIHGSASFGENSIHTLVRFANALKDTRAKKMVTRRMKKNFNIVSITW